MAKSFNLSRFSSSSAACVFAISSRNRVLPQFGVGKIEALIITNVPNPVVHETSWSYHPKESFVHKKEQGIVELERKGMVNVKPIMEENVRCLYGSMKPNGPDGFNFADLGCSLGPNKVAISPLPEIRLSMCPPHTRPCFVPKSPNASFHGRLFPDNSIHFLHSSYRLNWLSQVPKRLLSEDREEKMNKGNICVAKGSPIQVQGAYSNQFGTDLLKFLRSRSHEIVSGGRMLITFMGTNHNQAPNIWELLGTTLDDMMMAGLLEESTLDSLNIPFYAPCFEELRISIMKEASFRIAQHERIKMNWNGGRYCAPAINGIGNKNAQSMMMTLKTAGHNIFKDRLGDHITNDLFYRHSKKAASYLKTHDGLWTNHVISLIKK